MKLFLILLMIFIGKILATEFDVEFPGGFGYKHYYPIEVQMKCSQVNQQVLCGFDFTNNAKEDYYILKRDTPLDGLDSPYLAISQGNDVVEYAGIFALMATPTKDDYAFIQAGETITASIDLASSYKFTRDGMYTVEYTKPLVYISSQEMSTMSNEDLLQQASHYEDLVVSTEVEVVDSHNLEPTLAEIESAEGESTSSEDETVYINARCSPIGYTSYGAVGAFNRAMKCFLKEIQDRLCNQKYGLQKALSTSAQTGPEYVKWFGAYSRINEQAIARRQKVDKVLRKIMINIVKQTAITYSNGGSQCTARKQGYVVNNNQRRLFICPQFYELCDYSCENNHTSKFQLIAYLLSRKFGKATVEYLVGVRQSGYNRCTALATNHPDQAVKNSENYGYFIQDILDANIPKKN